MPGNIKLKAKYLATTVLARVIAIVIPPPEGYPCPSDAIVPQVAADKWVSTEHQDHICEIAASDVKRTDIPVRLTLGPVLEEVSKKSETFLKDVRETKDISPALVTLFVTNIYLYFLYEVEYRKEEMKVLLNDAYITARQSYFAMRNRDTNPLTHQMYEKLIEDLQKFYQNTMDIEKNKRHREEQPKREVIPPANLKREFDEVASPHNLRPRDSKRQRKA
jgi:hypothetical protein